MASFAGLVALGNTIDVVVVSRNSSQVPTNSDSAPIYRIYGPAGFMTSGSLTAKESGTITNCPPASPTVYTSVGHNLTVGTKVTITGIGGNTGANGTFDVSAVTTNTFTVATDTSSGGAYTSGGSWSTTGLYDFNFTPTVGANFASGTVYQVVVYCKFSSVVNVLDSFAFQVT